MTRSSIFIDASDTKFWRTKIELTASSLVDCTQGTRIGSHLSCTNSRWTLVNGAVEIRGHAAHQSHFVQSVHDCKAKAIGKTQSKQARYTTTNYRIWKHCRKTRIMAAWLPRPAIETTDRKHSRRGITWQITFKRLTCDRLWTYCLINFRLNVLLENEKSKTSDEKSIKRKNELKTKTRLNITERLPENSRRWFPYHNQDWDWKKNYWKSSLLFT